MMWHMLMHADLAQLALAPLSLAQAEAGDVGRALSLMVVGMAVVFAALVVLLLVISLINRLMPVRPTSPGPGAAAARTPAPAGQVDPQLIAVLAAAASTALHRPVRVEAVRLREPSTDGPGEA